MDKTSTDLFAITIFVVSEWTFSRQIILIYLNMFCRSRKRLVLIETAASLAENVPGKHRGDVAMSGRRELP